MRLPLTGVRFWLLVPTGLLIATIGGLVAGVAVALLKTVSAFFEWVGGTNQAREERQFGVYTLSAGLVACASGCFAVVIGLTLGVLMGISGAWIALPMGLVTGCITFVASVLVLVVAEVALKTVVQVERVMAECWLPRATGHLTERKVFERIRRDWPVTLPPWNRRWLRVSGLVISLGVATMSSPMLCQGLRFALLNPTHGPKLYIVITSYLIIISAVFFASCYYSVYRFIEESEGTRRWKIIFLIAVSCLGVLFSMMMAGAAPEASGESAALAIGLVMLCAGILLLLYHLGLRPAVGYIRLLTRVLYWNGGRVRTGASVAERRLSLIDPEVEFAENFCLGGVVLGMVATLLPLLMRAARQGFLDRAVWNRLGKDVGLEGIYLLLIIGALGGLVASTVLCVIVSAINEFRFALPVNRLGRALRGGDRIGI